MATEGSAKLKIRFLDAKKIITELRLLLHRLQKPK